MESINKRNKWTYSVGGIGRDMMFILVSMFTLAYIQYTMRLSVVQFSAVSVIMIIARVWDGINDPMMGMIIENASLKSGKFKPWILIGGCINFVVTILLFTIRPDGWLFVLFFGFVYITWGMTFTINDIAYWSLLPNLAKDNDSRNKLTNLVLVFASIGQFLAGGLIPVLVTGNAVKMYRLVGIAVSFIFLCFTLLTYFGVQENRTEKKKAEKVSIKKMFQILTGNDQLVVMTAVLLLHTLSSELFVAFALNFFYFEFGYGGEYLMVFTVIFGLATLLSLAAFSFMSKVLKRMQVIKIGAVILALGYSLFFLNGTLIPMNLITLYGSAFLVFFGISLYYVVIIVMTANTIEYNEYHTGMRNESIIFSVRPLMTKIGAAIQQLVVTVVLILSGILSISSRIAELEISKGQGGLQDITAAANALLAEGSDSVLLSIRVGMALIPMLCMLAAFVLIIKKYKIDEEKFDFLLKALRSDEK
jgi:melibiose permease/lactose/raffinose/galactose permease